MHEETAAVIRGHLSAAGRANNHTGTVGQLTVPRAPIRCGFSGCCGFRAVAVHADGEALLTNHGEPRIEFLLHPILL